VNCKYEVIHSPLLAIIVVVMLRGVFDCTLCCATVSVSMARCWGSLICQQQQHNTT